MKNRSGARLGKMEQRPVPCKAVFRIEGKKVLVLAPHPGDEVFGCGGTIMRHVAAGDILRVSILTDGEYCAGGAEQQSTSRELRREESNMAAGILGYGKPEFWGLPGHGLEYGEFLVQRIENVITALGADLIYAPSIYETHPDHRALGMAALEAVRRCKVKLKLAMYEMGVPMPHPNLLLDISGLRERKQEAMACFVSQLKEQPCDQHIGALNRFRTHNLGPQATAAEAYFLAQADDLKTDILKIYASEHQRQHEIGLPMMPEDVPLVSVLIRSMDRPQLQDALDSLALQTYANIEVVVINARAEAHRPLGAWCGRFPLRMVNTGTPLMRSRAANVGLDNATGDYLMFLDDDDWWAPNHISGLVEALKNNTTRRVAYAGVEFRGENRGKLELSPFNEPFDAGRLRGGNYIPIHAIMFARTLLGQGLRFDEAFEVYEDWDFLLQLSQFTGFVHVADVRAYYRASGTSGVGVYADNALKRKAREQIFEKWKNLWSGAQIDDLIKATSNLAIEPIALLRNELDQSILNLQEREVRLKEIEKIAAELEKSADELEKNVSEGGKAIVEAKKNAAELETKLQERDRVIWARDARIDDILTSTSWRLSAPVRWVGGGGRKLKRVFLEPAMSHHLWRKAEAVRVVAVSQLRSQSLPSLLKRALRVLRYEGLQGVKTRIRHQQRAANRTKALPSEAMGFALKPTFIVRDLQGRYEMAPASKGYTYIEPQRPVDIDAQLNALGSAIRFSIVVPVYNTAPGLLDAVLSSVQAQWYPHWQLILADDASPAEDTRHALEGIDHPQIKLLRLASNQGIAGATNAALDAVDGDFIVFMDHDDEITVDCLYELALCISRAQPDFIYSDEDKLTEQGEYTQPHFKPDWSPDTMMSTMFTGHVSCVRRSLLEKVGGLRPQFDGCQDWDLVLRVTENTSRISHIPKVLYHWRIIPASVASDIAAKPYVLDASRRVRIDALARRGLEGAVEPVVQVPGYFRINYHLRGTPKISIIIPSRDRGDVLRCCIESIHQKSTYRNFEIIILDNGSVDSLTLGYLQKVMNAEQAKVIRHDAPFNFSELNNIGAQHASGKLLLFLNDDTEVLCNDWLERMGGYAQLPHIAAVGAKLLYPGSTEIQHAGVLNLANGPVHAFLRGYSEMPGYFMRNLLEYDWLAVTGACLMIETEKFNAFGGFDTSFPVAYNDIELCLRGIKNGFYNVVCQAVTLIHHESVSRGLDHVDQVKQARLYQELRRLYDTHPSYFQYDPFHNPNLDPCGLNFEVPN
jgi:glycosyltransferase involved in cell wall biosynthesis/LmbE family N-acetylglucosaminyl deacetylase